MNENRLHQLLMELKQASKECWAARMLLHDMRNKYGSLCVNIMIEGRQFPALINNRMQKRRDETGLDPVHPDFWDADMIIALYEYFENLNILEDFDGTT